MLNELLKRSDARLSVLQCCKQDGSICDCLSSLHDNFTDIPDSYDCEKKMSTYVLRYGAAYASEIYHYLVASNFKSKIDVTRPLKVISLGCGFSPDYFAIKKYFEVNDIHVPIKYVGVDNSQYWESVRPRVNECKYFDADLTLPFPKFEADVVVVGKVFSTLYRNSKGTVFLNNLKQAVNDSFRPDTRLVFADINNRDLGRDLFHKNIITLLPNCTQYFYNLTDCYVENNWVPILQHQLAFDIPDDLSVVPLASVRKTVIFEYRK